MQGWASVEYSSPDPTGSGEKPVFVHITRAHIEEGRCTSHGHTCWIRVADIKLPVRLLLLSQPDQKLLCSSHGPGRYGSMLWTLLSLLFFTVK